MESAEELQQQEITALQSIYAEDFKESPPPKAWKGAARLPEFIIRVPHPNPQHAAKIYFHLNIKFPKTYPALACPTFSIQKPVLGLNNDQVTKLSNEIHTEAQKHRGSEMVFQIITFAQDWMENNVKPAVEVSGSLATAMKKRASEAERERQHQLTAEAEREAYLAAELAEQFRAESTVQLQKQRQKHEDRNRNRHRAQSDATEVPQDDVAVIDMVVESFNNEIEFGGVTFNSVKIFHPKQECLGMTYLADPVCDDVRATLPLEVHIITFVSNYYSTSQGRKKLKQVEAEINRVSHVSHPNLLRILAVKLSLPHGNGAGPARLVILSEGRPRLSLEDLLEDCENLRENRASDYLTQCLLALNAIHTADLVHRGLTTRCIGLATRGPASPANTPSKLVKIGKVGYHTRLLDLHRSNPVGPNIDIEIEATIPDAWLSKDIIDSPLLYTRSRDIYCLGLVLLQMLCGKDVIHRFPSGFQSALRASSISPALQQYATNMLLPTKKTHMSCLGLLVDLSEMSSQDGTTPHGRTRSQSIAMSGPKTPRASTANNYSSSPEIEYFVPLARTRQASRWKEDWEELEMLGKGAFGSVVKARNKIDSRTYAVKKIKLRANQSDTKIFREVNALSRLSHRFIVRYYTTWVETSESASAAVSSGSTSGTDATDDGTAEDDLMTSVPHSSHSNSTEAVHASGFNGRFSIDLNDLDDMGLSGTQSFPSIHFGGSTGSKEKNSDEEDDSDNSDDPFGNLFSREDSSEVVEVTRHRPKTPPVIARTLYIQMEFVERQTLKERVAEGITEDEGWRLFQQILDALVHMSGLGILHRDIKLTNIFIDREGDCKVGDFGLATSSLAAVDPSDVSPVLVAPDADMTLEVGTKLYIAPEVQSRKRGPRNHTKADMYSLGIVFFEMNFLFSTASERIAVIEDLRKPGIFFPTSWLPHLARQKQIITSLLQHDPTLRPTAMELSQSPLLPQRLEDEYFKGALKMMTKSDSPHHQAVLSSLFNQPPNPVRGYLYDVEADLHEYASLNHIVHDRIAAIFRLHGAVDMQPLLLMPIENVDAEQNQAIFLDRHGEVVTLANNALVPFARLAARGNIKRIKRYHVTDIYKPNTVAGHPRVSKAAVFDIITPDLESGPMAASAEILTLLNDCLRSFPNLVDNYEIHISHSQVVDLALNRIPNDLRSAVIDIMNQSKSSPSQKRALLLKTGLLRSTTDELEVLAEVEDDVDVLRAKLERISPTLLSLMSSAIDDIKRTIQYAVAAGLSTTVFCHPLMWGQHHAYFKDGVRIEVVRRTKRLDILAAAGRYDGLIAKCAPPKVKAESICAIGMQINLDKITVALATFQSSSVKTLIKEARSFGFWSPRRCDVYVVSYHPGYLQDRLEVAALLWQHNISADVMYESGLTDEDQENHVELCCREGILFTVYPRPRTARREQPAFKVKSILKGTEYEVSRQELVGHLHQQIAEQKRADLSTSGTAIQPDAYITQNVIPNKDITGSSDVQLVLPGDTKKQRKQVKQIFLDRAYEKGEQIKLAVQNGMPILAVDVPTSLFDAMTKATGWTTDDDAWRNIISSFAPSHSAYAGQVREAVGKRRADGYSFLLLFAVREERFHLLSLS